MRCWTLHHLLHSQKYCFIWLIRPDVLGILLWYSAEILSYTTLCDLYTVEIPSGGRRKIFLFFLVPEDRVRTRKVYFPLVFLGKYVWWRVELQYQWCQYVQEVFITRKHAHWAPSPYDSIHLCQIKFTTSHAYFAYAVPLFCVLLKCTWRNANGS